MKSVIIATLIASAAAFAPAQQKSTSTSLAAFEDELGVQVCCSLLKCLRLRRSSLSTTVILTPSSLHSLTSSS